MRLTYNQFLGMRPAVEPHLLRPNEAQNALDVRLETGALIGAPVFSNVKALTKANAITLWRYPAPNETDYWLEFNVRADVARSPVNQDVWDRIYWTDDTGAHYGPSSVVLSGVSFPGAGYDLGVPLPDNIPNISAFTPGSGPTLESRAYRETFVTAYKEEGAPGPASARADVNPANPVSIDNLTPVPSGSFNIATRRIYRSSFTGNGQANWQLVDEIPVAQLSYTDTKTQDELDEVNSTETYLPPPAGVFGLRITEGGVAIVGKGRDVYFSEIDLPHAFNPDYIQTLQYDFVAVASFDQAVVVLTTGDLYVANGVDPAELKLTRIEQPYPCLSAQGVCEGKGGALYPSNEGLVAIGGDFQPVVVTAGLMTQEQWLAYNPSSFKAAMQNGKYHAAFTRLDGSTGILVIDPTGKSAPMTVRSQIAGQPIKAAFHDRTTDTLYVARGGEIQRLEKTGAGSTLVWRGREELTQSPAYYTAFLILGDVGTATFRVYQAGVLVHTKTLPIGQIGRMKLPRKKSWSFEVESASKIVEVRVATSVQELFE